MTPSRRVRPQLLLSRAAFSAGETTRLDLSADDQKREHQEDDVDEENVDERRELLHVSMKNKLKIS